MILKLITRITRKNKWQGSDTDFLHQLAKEAIENMRRNKQRKKLEKLFE